jgi:endonuclease YncB( thermonuclease family)
MVTAETAMAVPSLLLVAAFLLTAVGAVVTRERCLDAARETVRAAARGESDPDRIGQRVAPANAGITLTTDGDTITARVTAPVKPFGVRLPGLNVEESATAVREDTGDARAEATR